MPSQQWIVWLPKTDWPPVMVTAGLRTGPSRSCKALSCHIPIHQLSQSPRRQILVKNKGHRPRNCGLGVSPLQRRPIGGSMMSECRMGGLTRPRHHTLHSNAGDIRHVCRFLTVSLSYLTNCDAYPFDLAYSTEATALPPSRKLSGLDSQDLVHLSRSTGPYWANETIVNKKFLNLQRLIEKIKRHCIYSSSPRGRYMH